MELRHPWVLAVASAAVLCVAAIAVLLLLARRRRRAEQRVAVSNTSALTALTAYASALRRHRLRLALMSAGAVVALAGTVIGLARPVSTTVDRPEVRNRDIVLCLDTSGSMARFDAALVSTFQGLVRRFEGERIGLVIFNGSAATVFPLTDDYAFIEEELATAQRALSGDPDLDWFFGGTYSSSGTSLIGDGVASCVGNFDRVDQARPRALVLATDNQLAGYPFIELSRAAELAKSRNVRIYALNPADSESDRVARELESVATDTGGAYYAFDEDAGDTEAIGGIVEAVQAQEAGRLQQSERVLRTDTPAVPIGLAAAGVTGLVLASRRWAR